MSFSKHTTRSRALAVATAGVLALGGVVATTATGVAEPALSDVTSAAEAAQIAADQTPTPGGNGAWIAETADTSNYNPTKPLSAIVLYTDGASGSSPQQVALFEYDNYIGTTQPEAYPFQNVERTAPDKIKVDYHYLLPGDSNADPQGRATSEYTLMGSDGVVQTGDLPPTGDDVPA